MPSWEDVVMLGIVVALAADALAVIEGLPRVLRQIRRWLKNRDVRR